MKKRNPALAHCVCPSCGERVDAATSLGDSAELTIGCASICLYCHSFCLFIGTPERLELRLMTEEEIAEKYRLRPAALRKYIAALETDTTDDIREEALDLERLLEAMPARGTGETLARGTGQGQ